MSLILKKESDINMFVCCHKPVVFPISDDLSPIHVGKDLSSLKLEMIGDNTGLHISDKNPYFCELTATYWIWKNCQSDVVGLLHYRRFLNLLGTETVMHRKNFNSFEKIGLTANRVRSILKEYDVILPYLTKPHKETVYQLYAQAHVGSDLDFVYQVISCKYPDMAQTAYQCLYQESQGYIGNIMIAKKEIFDQYAAWLFDVLFEVEKEIQSSLLHRDAYQQRAYGFLAERMMRIFIVYQQRVKKIKILEQPLLFVTDDYKYWCKYRFRSWKRKLFSKLGLKKKYWVKNETH